MAWMEPLGFISLISLGVNKAAATSDPVGDGQRKQKGGFAGVGVGIKRTCTKRLWEGLFGVGTKKISFFSIRNQSTMA